MSPKKPTVGARLAGLIAAPPEPEVGTITLPVTAVQPGTVHQPRRRFDEAGLQQLAASIKERGILQPLLVRPRGDGYEIVAGERRWRAAQLAGLSEVPVTVQQLDDSAALELALMENLQREDLSTIDQVDATLLLIATRWDVSVDAARHRLLGLLRAPNDEAAVEMLERLFRELGGEHWTSFAKNKVRILNWPAPVLAAMREQGLPYSIAGLVAAAPPEAQAELLKFALSGASKARVQAALKQLKARPAGRLDRERLGQLGRKLASARWQARLSDVESRQLEAWLAKMPEELRKATGLE
ncbi:ParB/RepB/Spo0J family partition protein [Deinococcus sonorensis]|uniref:ParB/RepB/Spo0J family partition protein n=2 Tax=Deinococcus sonorensis TaxID=309891 RepID=A0AAU7U6A7_9DEIO